MDKANGYCFGVQEQRSLEAMMSAAMGADFHFSSYPWGTGKGRMEEPQTQKARKEIALGYWEKCKSFSLLCVLRLKEKEVLEEGEGGVAGSGALGCSPG